MLGRMGMKKILFLMLGLLVVQGTTMAYDCNSSVLSILKDKQIIDFNPTTKEWSRNLGLNDYVFTKHVTVGSGGYTELTLGDKTFDTNSTYEFTFQSRLFAYNAHQLKFFELGFDGENFVKRDLAKEEVQMFFPDVEILSISEFKDNEIEVKLPIFRKKAFMLLNDTERDFYKYKFEYHQSSVPVFNNIFELRMPRTMVFSHFKSRDEMFPILRIKVKPQLREQPQIQTPTEEIEEKELEL